MRKSIAAAVFGVFEIINYLFGHDWMWSSVTEEEVGILMSAILPFVIWFVPEQDVKRRP